MRSREGTFGPCRGRLTISRPSNTRGDGPTVEIRVAAQDGAYTTVEVEVDIALFTLALTGQGEVPCVFEGLDPRSVARREHKVEQVLIPYPGEQRYMGRDEQAMAAYREALKPFEVDGWAGSVEDCHNGHRRIPPSRLEGFHGEGYNVTFYRVVTPDGRPLPSLLGMLEAATSHPDPEVSDAAQTWVDFLREGYADGVKDAPRDTLAWYHEDEAAKESDSQQ